MVNIHCHLRVCVQNRFAHVHVNLHGLLGIILAGTSRLHLEGTISIRIHICQILNYGLAKLFEALILHIDNRADTGNTEHLLQLLHSFLIIEIRQGIHEDSSLGLVNEELSLTFLQGMIDLVNQCILKQIPVFSLDSDFCVLNQKCCKHINSFRIGPMPFWCIASIQALYHITPLKYSQFPPVYSIWRS